MIMVMVVCGSGDKIIILRNVYKLIMIVIVFFGVILIFIYFEIDNELGIFYGIIFEFVKWVFIEYLDVKGFFVINLIYFGVVVDLKSIVEFVYLFDVLVFVDEVYGVYIYFYDELLFLVMQVGVDIVVISVYKLGGLLM